MSAPLVILATGGTGGHMFPAEALAGVLAERGYRLALITDHRGDAFSGVLGDLGAGPSSRNGMPPSSMISSWRQLLWTRAEGESASIETHGTTPPSHPPTPRPMMTWQG